MSLTLWNEVLSTLDHEGPAGDQVTTHGSAATHRSMAPTTLQLRRDDGSTDIVPVHAWAGQLDHCDRLLLRSLRTFPGPVLDVGCGPGRLAAAAAKAGLPSLGIDVAPAAVRMARARGAVATVASVFDALPHPGPWQHVLLIDGNLGIGGCPTTLLRRCRELLGERGMVHAEFNAPGTRERTGRVRLERRADGALGEWFPWAEVSLAGLSSAACAAGLTIRRLWTGRGRWFAVMVVDRG